MTQNLKYKKGGDNSFLRYALWRLWDRKCYWCGTPLEGSTYAEIDHILPQEGFESHLEKYAEGSSFDVHDAENLAPICAGGRRCNQRKLNKVPRNPLGAISESLDRASKLAPQVRDMQSSISRAQGVEKSIVSIVSGQLTNRVRKLLEEYGEDLVHRLYALQPQVLESYIQHKPISGDFDPGREDHTAIRAVSLLSIPLDSKGRFIFEVSRQLFQVDLSVEVGKSIDNVVKKVEAQLECKIPKSADHYQDRSDLTRLSSGYNLELMEQQYNVESSTAITAEMNLIGEGVVSASTVGHNDGEYVDGNEDWEVTFSAHLYIYVDANGPRETISKLYVSFNEN